jgi:hypothetical protein
MPLISQADAYLETAALHPALVEATQHGVASWRELVLEHSALAKPLDETTRANFIHDHSASQLEILVDQIPGARFDDCLGFDALRVSERALLRHKYVGNGKPSNVSTRQQKMLARQEYTPEALELLELAEPPTLLTCGYTLDGLNLERVEIRMDCEGLLPWSFDIFGGEFVGEPLVLPGMEDDIRPTVVKSASKKTQVMIGVQESPEPTSE